MQRLLNSFEEVAPANERSSLLARNISLVSLSMNTVLNFKLFPMFIVITFMRPDYQCFAVAGFVHALIYCIFELKFVIKIWKRSTQVRTAILIYGAVLLFSIIITDLFFMNKTFLFLFSACLWIPQIIENIWNKSRQIDIEFILVITANHCVFPLYIRGYSGNSLMLEFDLMWAFVFVAFICMQILVLVMQSRYGVYFFLPNFMRPGRVCFTKVEQINDELKTLECCICMSSLVTVEDHEEYDAMNEKVTYMETPCGHKYHSSCLTTMF